MRPHVNIVVIQAQPPAKCELCGKVDELRPYGPGGKAICFDCAMKPENKAETDRRCNAFLSGTDPDQPL